MHDTDIQTPGSNGRPVPLGSVTHAASRGVMVRRFAERAVASRAAVFTDIGLSIAADMRVCDLIADMYERRQDIRGDRVA